jgi:octaprenyl-diphosphate synthase
LKDDCLDYASELETMGKQSFADLREGKITLPLILTLKRCRTAERDHVSSVLKTAARLADEYGGTAPGDAPELEFAMVGELIETHRGLIDTQRRAEEHVAKALDAIAPFPDGPAKEALAASAKFSVVRDR